MKFYLDLPHAQNVTTYTHRLLEHLGGQYGHRFVADVKDADYILISMTGFQEFQRLVSLRRRVKDKKIVVGGHAGFIPRPLLAYADYVNVGQGFEFFRDVGKGPLDDLPYILSPDSVEAGKIAEPSTKIDWGMCPIIQIGKNSYSFFYSTGCRNKCKFCFTSWLNPHQTNPAPIAAVRSKVPKGKQLYIITNEYDNIPIGMNVVDVTVRGFLDAPSKYSKVRWLRAGVEAPTEETRRFLSKPISDTDLRDFIDTTFKMKKNVKLFLIPGLNTMEEWTDFVDVLGYNIMTPRPPLSLIFNYFEPMVGTPLQDYDLEDIIEIDMPRLQYHYKIRNCRTRFWGFNLKLRTTLFRALLSRSDTNETRAVWELRKAKTNEELWDGVRNGGFEHLVHEYPYKNPVNTLWKGKRRKTEDA